VQQLQLLHHMAVAPYHQGTVNPSTGSVYMADTSNNRIQVFDCTGNFIAKWGILWCRQRPV
jgi:DNA-binding beta-propeller fold protein YncE